MRLFALILSVAFLAVGCSSNDDDMQTDESSMDNPPMDDSEISTSTATLTLDQENVLLQTGVIVASLKPLRELNDFVTAIEMSDRSVESCSDGGIKRFTSRGNDQCVGCQEIFDLYLDNCEFDGQFIDGQVVLFHDGDGPGRRFGSVTYENQEGQIVNLDGAYTASPSVVENLDDYGYEWGHRWTLDLLNYANNDSIVVNTLQAEYKTIPSSSDPQTRDVIQYSTWVKFVSDATGGLIYTLRSVHDLERTAESPFFDAGYFRVFKEDDVALDIGFETGDPSTLFMSLSNESGSEDKVEQVSESLEKLLFRVSATRYVF